MIPAHLSEKLSFHARRTLREAENLALLSGVRSVEPKHLFLALLSEGGSLGNLFLSNAGLKKNIEEIVSGNKAKDEAPARKTATRKRTRTRLPLSPDMKTILSRAYLVASQFHSPYVGTEHLAHALLDNPDADTMNILDAAGVEEDRLLDNLEAHLSFENFPNFGKMLDLPDVAIAKKNQGDTDSTPFLSQYTTDLGEEARSRGEDLYGREQERDRIIRILGRKHKNNPLLLGEPGVGKTAIVAALARAAVEGSAPAALTGKRILALDLALVVAGTSFRGEFEARLKEIVREAGEHPEVVLFIDEIHTIVGAGNTQGGLDAANILKPALARGDIRIIGATTLAEYKRHIEKDPALDRRFQAVLVREPSPEETKKLLRRVKRSYETFHGVSLAPGLLDLAVDLSVRHSHDRFLPDKALDILDEASSLAKNRRGASMSVRTAAALESARKNILNEKELLLEEGRFDEAADMLEEERRISMNIAKLRKEDAAEKKRDAATTVTDADIFETVSAMTGIPFAKLAHEEPKNRFSRLRSSLRGRVVGQEEAVGTIERALLRSLSDIGDPDRPLGSFLFLGPTGVGKTLIAKAVAEEFFGDRNRLIRLDMSEFMERHSVAQMIGAPAGYIGYGEGGKLTEKIRRNPHAIVLFDEIEKAHPDVFNILLQILDEGLLTDAEGRRASFRHAIIVLTSNIGTEAFAQSAKIGFSERGATKSSAVTESVKNQVLEELKKTLRPELLARIDRTVVFNALGVDVVERIAALELAALKARLAKKGISLSYTKDIAHFIAEKSYAPEHGARLVRKHIETLIEHPVAERLVAKQASGKRRLALSLKKDVIACVER